MSKTRCCFPPLLCTEVCYTPTAFNAAALSHYYTYTHTHTGYAHAHTHTHIHTNTNPHAVFWFVLRSFLPVINEHTHTHINTHTNAHTRTHTHTHPHFLICTSYVCSILVYFALCVRVFLPNSWSSWTPFVVLILTFRSAQTHFHDRFPSLTFISSYFHTPLP